MNLNVIIVAVAYIRELSNDEERLTVKRCSAARHRKTSADRLQCLHVSVYVL